MSIADPTAVESKHFHLEAVADGVPVAIASVDGGAVCNAGLIDLGDQVVIFDTFLTPQAALDLHAAAERLFDHPITTIINSHWHNDHVNGNMVFPPDIPILATDKTRELLATYGQEELVEDLRRLVFALQE